MNVLRRRWTTKPPLGAQIDWGHPLARGLSAYVAFNGAGTPVNLARNSRIAAFSGTYGRLSAGQVTTYNGTSHYAEISGGLLSATPRASLVLGAVWDSYGTADDLMAEYTNNFNSKNGFIVDPDQSSVFAIKASAPGSLYNGGTIVRPSAGVLHHYVFNFNRTTGTSLSVSAYVDGKAVTVTQVETGDLGGNNFDAGSLWLMSRGGASLFGDGSLLYAALYTRTLLASEAAQYYHNPYALVAAPSPRIFVNVPRVPAAAAVPRPYPSWVWRRPQWAWRDDAGL